MIGPNVPALPSAGDVHLSRVDTRPRPDQDAGDPPCGLPPLLTLTSNVGREQLALASALDQADFPWAEADPSWDAGEWDNRRVVGPCLKLNDSCPRILQNRYFYL